jgi:hypothetical protein
VLAIEVFQDVEGGDLTTGCRWQERI